MEVHQWVGPLFLLVMDIYAKVIHMKVTKPFIILNNLHICMSLSVCEG